MYLFLVCLIFNRIDIFIYLYILKICIINVCNEKERFYMIRYLLGFLVFNINILIFFVECICVLVIVKYFYIINVE